MKRLSLILAGLLISLPVAARPHQQPEPKVYQRQPEIVVDSRQIKDYQVLRIETPHGWLIITASGGRALFTTYVPDEYHEWQLEKPYNSFEGGDLPGGMKWGVK